MKRHATSTDNDCDKENSIKKAKIDNEEFFTESDKPDIQPSHPDIINEEESSDQINEDNISKTLDPMEIDDCPHVDNFMPYIL